MKKIFVMLSVFGLYGNLAYGYDVCSADFVNTDYAYTDITTQGDLDIASWAVGVGCGGDKTTNTDIPAMCTKVTAGGQGFCASLEWQVGKDLDETTSSYGIYCWCRRTHMMVGDALAESTGQWVLLGQLSGTCQYDCAKYCAMNVAENAGGMRHAIMLLPQF